MTDIVLYLHNPLKLHYSILSVHSILMNYLLLCRIVQIRRRSGRTSNLLAIPPQLPSISTFFIMPFPRPVLSQLNSLARRNVARQFHSSPLKAAVAHPITAHGPPPKAPAPAESFKESQKNDLTSTSAEGVQSQAKPSAALKKRFWKDVHVQGKSGKNTTNTPFEFHHGRGR